MKICLSWCGYNVVICLSQGLCKQNSSVLGVLAGKTVSPRGALQAKVSVPGAHRQNLFVLGVLAKVSVPGGSQAKFVCPRGALQVEVSVPGGSQTKFVCPRGALQVEVSAKIFLS